MIFSPQMLNTFQECPVKYFFKYVRNIQAPVLENTFIVGKNIHAIAAYYLKGQNISMFELSEKERLMWDILVKSEYFNLKTVRVESTVAAQIAGSWIGGRLDALVKNDNNDYFILDYKTGQIPKNPEENFQTIVYLLCCDKLLPSECNSLNFTYISVKTGDMRNIKFTETLKKEYEEKVIRIIEDIKRLHEPVIKRTELCKLCPYSKICV